MTGFAITILFDISVYCLLALAFNITGGYLNYLNFAIGALFGLGAYFAGVWIERVSVDIFLALPLAVVLGAAGGFIVAILTKRVRGVYFLILTVGIQIAFTEFVKNSRFLGGASGLFGFPRPTILGMPLTGDVPMFALSLLVLTTFYFLYRRMIMSPFGRLMIGVRNNESALSGIGKQVERTKVQTFLVSGAMCGAAGCIYAIQTRAVSPGEFDLDMSMLIAVMTTLGGLGSFYGPFLGVITLVSFNELLKSLSFPPELNEFALRRIAYGALLIFLVGSNSGGLASLLNAVVGYSRPRR